MRYLPILLMLAACGPAPTTPEGCPIFMTELMQAQTRACVAAYYAEKARAAGQPVTTCYPSGGTVTCVTQ